MARVIVELGLDDLDAAAIRSTVLRAVTRAASRCIYDTNGFAGIAYLSRFGDEIMNWAVFEPFAAIRSQTLPQSVEFVDADFIAALAVHRLTVE